MAANSRRGDAQPATVQDAVPVSGRTPFYLQTLPIMLGGKVMDANTVATGHREWWRCSPWGLRCLPSGGPGEVTYTRGCQCFSRQRLTRRH
jgi:hypothetical protein